MSTSTGEPAAASPSGPHRVLSSRRPVERTPPTTDADAAFRTAVGRHLEGDVDGAVEAYRVALEEDPHHAGAINNLALALLQGGAPAASIATLRTLGPIDELSPTALVNLGNAHLAAGDAVTAVPVLQRAALLDPESNAWAPLGAALLATGDAAAAASALVEAVEAFPGRSDTWRLLAVARASAGDEGGAIQAFRVALDHDPTHAPSWRQLSCLLLLRADLGSAVVAGRRAVAADSADGACRRQLAASLVAIGDAVAAAQTLDEWLADDHVIDRDLVLVDRAVIALAAGEPALALQLLEQVDQEGDAAGRAGIHLALALLASGEESAARRRLASLVERDDVGSQAKSLLDQTAGGR